MDRDITISERLRAWARVIKRDVHALYLASRDPRVPWYAKAAAIAVAAYALSPIDLIPAFIPVLGYLDDLLIVPLGILLAVRLVPGDLMAEFRASAISASGERVIGRFGAAIIVLLWALGIALGVLWVGAFTKLSCEARPNKSIALNQRFSARSRVKQVGTASTPATHLVGDVSSAFWAHGRGA